MALSKKDLVIHITLNELYNTHSLILQHIEVLVRISSSVLLYVITDRDHCSRPMTSNIYASSRTSWVRHPPKYRAKRTGQ